MTSSLHTKSDLLAYIQNNVIGNDIIFQGPFGPRNMIYCDYTASGRCLRFIETYLWKYVYTFYSNTHSVTSLGSIQTTKFREEARKIIKHAVNATGDDVVIFTGNGTTSAIHKLIGVLEIRGEQAKKTAVLIGPYEHHSNILPWKEIVAKFDTIKQAADGTIDIADLEEKLKTLQLKGYNIIVSCSAASNVTGIMTDTVAVAEMAHKYSAIAVFDYATAAPYLKVDMNSSRRGYKDAIVCSPHKFVGGPGTPGLLIAKKWLFKNTIPDQAGGGTVVYVTQQEHAYYKDIESREEGGTPDIIGSIRCGLAFQLKEGVGTTIIEGIEESLCKRAIDYWKAEDALIILGNLEPKRIPIFSFMIKVKEAGKYLHHNFVAVLLGDLFGIQARGGCACAGPYVQELLNISERMFRDYKYYLAEDNTAQDGCATCIHQQLDVLKPGFCRLNFSYFSTSDIVQYILEAVSIVAHEGWKLLPQYQFDVHSGEWKHRHNADGKINDMLHSLNNNDYSMGSKHLKHMPKVPHGKLSLNVPDVVNDSKIEDMMEAASKSLIWFLTPVQANEMLQRAKSMKLERQKTNVPFKPRQKRSSIMPMKTNGAVIITDIA